MCLQEAVREIGHIERNLQEVFERRQHGVSKEIWKLIQGLESQKKDYYSKNGNIKGSLVKKELLSDFYQILLHTTALMLAQCYTLKGIVEHKLGEQSIQKIEEQEGELDE